MPPGSSDGAWLHVHYRAPAVGDKLVLTNTTPATSCCAPMTSFSWMFFGHKGAPWTAQCGSTLPAFDTWAELTGFCGDRGERRALWIGPKRHSNLCTRIGDKLWMAKTTPSAEAESRRAACAISSVKTAILPRFPRCANKADARHAASARCRVHTHPGGRGTWVSERRYEKEDCYGDNDGDSDTAMARIWSAGMATHVRLGDQHIRSCPTP